MKLSLLFIAIFCPFLIALFFDFSVLPILLFGNALIAIVCYRMLSTYKLLQSHFNSILIFTFFISLLAFLSYTDSVNIGNDENPFIPGGDGEEYFAQGSLLAKNNLFESTSLIKLNYLGYQIILGAWFKIVGINLLNGLFLNYFFLIISIVLISLSAYEITGNIQVSKYTLVLGFLCPLFIVGGIILLKDIFILYAFSLFLHNIIKIKNGYKNPLSIIYLIIAITIVGSFRLPYLVVLFLLIFTYKFTFSIKSVIISIFVILLFILMFPLFQSFSIYQFDEETVKNVVLDSDIVAKAENGKNGIIDALVSGYTSKPLLTRLIYLPIVFLVQFVSPFNFWEVRFLDEHWYYIKSQLNVFWFGFLGTLIFISLIKFKKIKISGTSSLFIFGFFLYVLMAFIYGGTIPRYTMPGILFMLPSFGYIMHKFQEDISFKKFVNKFFFTYYFSGILLFVIYIIYKKIS